MRRKSSGCPTADESNWSSGATLCRLEDVRSVSISSPGLYFLSPLVFSISLIGVSTWNNAKSYLNRATINYFQFKSLIHYLRYRYNYLMVQFFDIENGRCCSLIGSETKPEISDILCGCNRLMMNGSDSTAAINTEAARWQLSQDTFCCVGSRQASANRYVRRLCLHSYCCATLSQKIFHL